MTCIVWHDGVLAADMQISDNGNKYPGTKIFVRDDCLIGWCGSAYSAMAFLRWWEKKELQGMTLAESLQYYPEDEDNDFECIIVTKDKVETWNGKLAPVDQTKSDYVVLGSGSSVALGALYMKATAVQAVRAAIKHDSQCGYRAEYKTRDDIKKFKATKKTGRSKNK